MVLLRANDAIDMQNSLLHRGGRQVTNMFLVPTAYLGPDAENSHW